MLERKVFGSFATRCLLALALTWPWLVSSASARAASAFSLISSPQSWIGGGQSILVTQEDGFTFSGSLDSGWAANLSVNDFNGRTGQVITSWWLLELATPEERPLTPGTYPNAKKYPFQGLAFPGINFEGNGRSNNDVSGSFEVYELVAQPDGTILSFAADFIQYDEAITDWWNRGSLRLNSDRPLSFLPLPSVEPPPVPPSPRDPIIITPPPFVGGPGRNLPPDDPTFDNPPLVGSPGAPDPLPSPSPADPSPGAPPPGGSPPGTPDPVPGPLPVAAALGGWQVSRNLRRRCQDRP